MVSRYSPLTIESAAPLLGDTKADDLLRELLERKQRVELEQQRARELYDRFDALYYAEDINPAGGADLWFNHPSATTPGKSHVSINTPSVYVDIPAALQAVEPIENMVPTRDDDDAREAASATERIYYSWKAEEDFELKMHKACTAKELYGRVAARVYWEEPEEDGEKGHPCVEIIDQPRHLYLGWKSTDYDALYWAAYVTRHTPDAVVEEYGVEIGTRQTKDRKTIPWVLGVGSADSQPSRSWLDFGEATIDVWNYWFLKPDAALKRGSKTKMLVCNAVFAGNELVHYMEHPEYKGKFPILPLFNSYLPGVPDGRAALYDAEQIIREKYEKITAGSQMISAAVGGTFWQLTGPETTTGVVPEGVKPKLNQIISPGPLARIEPIQPNVMEVQLEQYLDRLDRELAVITGQNDLLLGLAPAQVLSSSKAINALIANFETRLSIRRALLYKWRKDIWDLAWTVWRAKDKDIRAIHEAGGGRLDITNPSLSPRDEMETATRALNLMNGKVWSQIRAMDAVGVDDPEMEQQAIRKERTDATLFPADVQVEVQLMSTLQAMQQQVPPGVQQQAGATLAQGQNDLRMAQAGGTPDNSTSSQLEGDQGLLPPGAGTPPPAPLVAQTMVKNGQATSRILSQQKIPIPGPPAPMRPRKK